MRRVTPALALVLLVVPDAGAASGLFNFLFGPHELEVITVTDASVDGRKIAAATPAQPQYYVAASLGFRDFGGLIGGIREPPVPDVHRLVTAELAKQGYLPAKIRGPAPTLLLVFTWGTLNAETLRADLNLPPAQLNRAQMVRFLGGPKVGLDDNFFNPFTQPVTGLTTYNYNARRIYEVAAEDFFVVVVAAYDYAAALRKEHRKPLWVTRIAAPSLGFELGDVLPAMLAIGGPLFGRDTPKPVWVNADDKFKPNVTLGELQLIEYLKEKPPVKDTDLTGANPKP